MSVSPELVFTIHFLSLDVQSHVFLSQSCCTHWQQRNTYLLNLILKSSMTLLSDTPLSLKYILLHFEKGYSSPFGNLDCSLQSKRQIFISQNIQGVYSSIVFFHRNEGLGLFLHNSQSLPGSRTVLEEVSHPKLRLWTLLSVLADQAAKPPTSQLCKYFPRSSKPPTPDSAHPLLQGKAFLMPFPRPSNEILRQLQCENSGFTSLNS